MFCWKCFITGSDVEWRRTVFAFLLDETYVWWSRTPGKMAVCASMDLRLCMSMTVKCLYGLTRMAYVTNSPKLWNLNGNGAWFIFVFNWIGMGNFLKKISSCLQNRHTEMNFFIQLKLNNEINFCMAVL